MKTNPYADPSTEKRLAYDAAAAMLARQDGDSLRYADLELRRRIEAIIYEKLKVYDILLPEGSVHTWQPPQAFEALVAIEPGAEDTYTYAIAPQREFGKIAEGSYRAVGVAPRASGLRRRGTNSEHIYMRNGRLRALIGHGPRPGRFWRRRWRTSRLW